MTPSRETSFPPQNSPQSRVTLCADCDDLRVTSSEVTSPTPNKPANSNRPTLESCQQAETRKSRRGRPELPPEERREHRVSVMVTARELQKLKEFARLEGTSISSAVRRLLSRSL